MLFNNLIFGFEDCHRPQHLSISQRCYIKTNLLRDRAILGKNSMELRRFFPKYAGNFASACKLLILNLRTRIHLYWNLLINRFSHSFM